MARQPRLVVPGLAHVVEQRGHNGQTIAIDEDDRQHWLQTLRDVLTTRRLSLQAYGLGTSSMRLLVTPPDETALSRLVQDLGRRYVAQFNARHRRSGTLWDGRFRCAAVEPGPLVLHAMAWVEAVGERADSLSSALHHVGALAEPAITDPAEYWALGNTPFERQDAWRLRLAGGPDAGLDQRVLKALRSGIPLGSADFLAQLQGVPQRRLFPRPRGRPPKV